MCVDAMEWDVLNAYAGIGGNRKEWENVNVTAVEIDPDIAAVYRDQFPQDTVIEENAHAFIREHFHEFDFIWSSPPCPTHSHVRNVANVGCGQSAPVYPDMSLYEEIIFLRQAAIGGWRGWEGRWVVENVRPYYRPLIRPEEIGRHAAWANFSIPSIDTEPDRPHTYRSAERNRWFDLSKYDIEGKKKGKILRNCVNPRIGRAILDAARSGRRQATFEDM